MKTSSISLRVADFLKGQPPFDEIEERDLVELAGAGRVKFHEGGEIVYEEGDARGRYAFVVQKGTVNLYRKSHRGEDLVDVRVEGDLLGFVWEPADLPYRCTTKTAGDTILYALPIEKLHELGERHTAVGNYFREYFGQGISKPRTAASHADPAVRGIDERPAHWLQRAKPVNERASNRLLTYRLDEPIRIVAKRLAPGLQEAIVAVDHQLRPVGVITESDLSGRVATGEISVDAPASEITSKSVVTVRPGMTAGQLILEMLARRLHHLVVTEDGTVNSPVIGIISDRSIQTLHGSIPTFLAKEISVAESPQALATLRDRADELLLHYIEGDAPVFWLADFVAEVDGAIAERAINLARSKLVSQGYYEPDVCWAWLAMHSEGRKERLLRSSQRTAIIYDDLPENLAGDADIWFSHLANEVTAMLAPCGFDLDPDGRMAVNANWRGSLTQWKERYSQWVNSPIESNILKLTPYFDARTIYGDHSLLDDLRIHIQERIHQNSHFMPLLANDAMDNLPPVTIFRDSVMDQSGTLWTCIDTKVHMMLPLVDIARVFALKLNLEDSTFTPLRFKRVGRHLIDHRDLFEEAAEAFSHAVRLQTKIGLRRGDDGQYVRPEDLPKIEVQRCKAIFKTIVRLMEFSADYFNLEGHSLA
ncbi:MAG: DUF294 nucleotidyltransferase-like domain-containing protein [Puniceicoccales bacterium]